MKGHPLIITGASRGIGAATARLAAARGYRVCVNYRENGSAADSVVAQIRNEGGEACAVRADVGVEADVMRLFDTCEEAFGKARALVNNAGILEQQMRLESMSVERLHRIFTTNVIGTMLCAREAARRMSVRRGGLGGAIVNLSSGAARLGSPGEYVDYAASKGAVDTLTVGLSKELAGEGIRVNAVRAGFIHTDMHASGGEPGRVERLRESIPLMRGGTPEEVARAILWLLSDEASYTTGSFVEVTGGR
jgi:NAD(P)-dependent dehydrogenase (short-subunit alcohol dehydrogenase family)